MNPPKSILDPSFKYVPAACTDVGATFRRIRAAQKQAAESVRAETQQNQASVQRIFALRRERGKS
jgi:hypothetical protein